MIYFAAEQSSGLAQAGETIRRTADSFFNAKSILSFFIILMIALVLGRIIAALLRRITKFIGIQADKTNDLNQVNRLRRIETLIVLSIAIIRGFLIIGAFYFWWVYTRDGQQPTAMLGATALTTIFVVGALNPIIRDLTYGSVMMAEHWFGVGDYVRIDPFDNLQGIVDRVTLRSTRIRGINGEIMWVNNQNIQAIRITPKGIRTLALDLLVSDLNRGLDLVAQTNQRLPNNPLMLARPLTIVNKQEVGNKLWHITAIGETAPGREWVLEDYALKLIKEIDESGRGKGTLLHEPIARYADVEAEKRFARSIKNSSKHPVKRQIPLTPLTPQRTRKKKPRPRIVS